MGDIKDDVGGKLGEAGGVAEGVAVGVVRVSDTGVDRCGSLDEYD